MRKLLLQGLSDGPLTEPAPRRRRRRARGAGGAARPRGARAARPQPRHPRGRRRLLQWLRAGDPRAQQRLLRPRALRPALRRLAAPCRRAAGHRAGHEEHARGAGAHLCRDARPRNGSWRSAIARCDGGCFAGSYAVVGGVSDVVPVDLHIPGCPPSPATCSRAAGADAMKFAAQFQRFQPKFQQFQPEFQRFQPTTRRLRANSPCDWRRPTPARSCRPSR